MKNLIAILTFVLSAKTAMATSLHPCTPTVRAVPTIMACVEGDIQYSILINTLMSPAMPMCSGKNHVEYSTAIVEVIHDGIVQQTLRISNGQFSYSLLGEEVVFKSEQFGLDLKKCSTPSFGGASIGN